MKPSIELIRLIAVILITFTHTRNHLESGIIYFIIEKLPTYGTSILSIVSGYLYYTVSRKKKNLFSKKIKTLAIPYLIANISILLVVLIFNFFFEYNALNRLSYDISIITEGIFSLNSPPINPPTYFIRDIFIIFSFIALISQKEYKSLFVLIPFFLFGTLMLRFDIAFLFVMGVFFAIFKNRFNKNILIFLTLISVFITALWIPEYLKFPICLLIFITVVNLDFKFYNTGRYSYLLHLYHSPIIVITYPVLSMYIKNALILIIAQIILAVVIVYFLFILSKKYQILKVLSGGR